VSDPFEQYLITARQRLDQGRYADCHAACMAALRLRPASAAPFALLGEIALRHNTFDKAADLYRRAADLDPRHPVYPAQWARALSGMNRMDAALAAARRAWALSPPDGPTLDTLGVIFSRAGEHDLAAAAFRRAATFEPGNPGYQFNLGWAEQFLGDFEASAAAYRAAIAADPAHDRAMSALVRLKRQTPRDNLIGPLEALFARVPDPERRLHIGHALAKTYEDLGQDDLSLQWLVKAKAGRRARATAGRAEREAMFEAAGRIVPQPRQPPGCPSEAPIFVFGLPRTGTTLVERILTSHSQVTSAGETMAMALQARRLAGAPSRELIDAATFRALQRADFRQLGEAFVAAARPPGPAPRFTEKTPLNFLYAGAINRALPNARMICLRRDPVDSCLSNFRQTFAVEFAYYDHTYDLEEMARYYVAFDRLMAHWRETLPAEAFLEVAYEDVVRDQEAQTRRLLAFCGLPWEDACLNFHENAAPVATASAVQVRQPIYQTSIGRAARYGGGLQPMTDVLRDAGLLDG
jgi:Flp pilus assembly protein TadD